jgi:hypothetical protein
MSCLVLAAGFCLSGGAAFGEEAPKKDDATIIAEQLPTYPLQTCVVSGEKLGGEMGKPVDYLHQGRLVRFCCKGCIKQFNAEPAKFLKVIDDAAAKAKGAAAPKDAQAAKAVYTCPMHPEVLSDQPGKCPKCGMALVKKGESGQSGRGGGCGGCGM